ncbi:hypothetical protein B7494_g5786 [Chlorociboria aeruginascens]|nr:hypothetical protein B7494_g5786 [Chlorociboria aeruginascens]
MSESVTIEDRHLEERSANRPPTSPRRDRDRKNAARRGRDTEVVTVKTEEDKQAAAKAEYEKLLTMRSGGTYIPPARLRALQSQITDKTSKEYQRMAWEALKKSINGLINKVNVSNIKHIVPELFGENLVRGRGLFCRSMMKAQAASLPFTPIYAAMAAIVNTKLPNVGELLLKRLIIQFKKGFKRNDKAVCLSATTFIAHLCNQQVADEVVAAQILLLLLNKPTDDSVEIAVGLTREVGQHLEEMSGPIALAVFDQFRHILNEADIDKRVQYMIEVLFQVRKDKYKDNPAIKEELDLVEEEDQITHRIALDADIDVQDGLNIFKFDPEWEENEEKYKRLKAEILGEGSDDEEDEDESDDSDDDEEKKEEKALEIKDQSNTDLLNLRRTIYLTIMSSIDPEECCHKLMKITLPAGYEMELPSMIIECCSQDKTYSKFYGLIGERFAKINRLWTDLFEQSFAKYYDTIHRYETNKLRNIARFFGHVLSSDAIGWHVLSVVHLNEEETTSSSRIFIKIMFQELSEEMGMAKLQARLKDNILRPYFEGLFPHDNPRNTRFSINYFTSIGMGVLTEEMREYLQNMPKPALPAPPAAHQDSDSSSSVSSYSTDSGTSRSGSRTPPRARALDRGRSVSRTPPTSSKGKEVRRGRSFTRSVSSDSYVKVSPWSFGAKLKTVSSSIRPNRLAIIQPGYIHDIVGGADNLIACQAPLVQLVAIMQCGMTDQTKNTQQFIRRASGKHSGRLNDNREMLRSVHTLSGVARRATAGRGGRGGTHLRISVFHSIKRPWEGDLPFQERNHGRPQSRLPPIDAVPNTKSSLPRGAEKGVLINRLGGRDLAVKKARYDGNDYSPFSRGHVDGVSRKPRTQAAGLVYSQNQVLENACPPSNQRGPPTGSLDFQDTSNLCRRCRKLAIHDSSEELGRPAICEDCQHDPELDWVTQAAAQGLTQLADTLRLGIASGKRGIISGPDQRRIDHNDYPPIAQFGLKQTLNWILGKINSANELADRLVQALPPEAVQGLIEKNIFKDVARPSENGYTDKMKRHIDPDADDIYRMRGDPAVSDAKLHTRRRSLTIAMGGGEDLLSMRSQSSYHPSPSLDGSAHRISSMNPPPAPTRQLPSPPGRSLPSPSSISFPSPTSSYGISSQAINLPPPSSLHQSVNTHLPPITPGHPSETALQTHSAALQHEVSVQKIAYSTLQGEHDKLLAALSRSQTRASALEKKFSVSDNEINTLTEEKNSLQAKVLDLERDVSELVKDRDEYRQAAVQEGAQYVEIVKKATQLEKVALEEKLSWNKLKADMERRIASLRVRTGVKDMLPVEDGDSPARNTEDPNDAKSPHDHSNEVKIEIIERMTSHPELQESTKELKEEIQRLRNRCGVVEAALRAVHEESRSMESIVEALSSAGKSIIERSDAALEERSGPDG